MSLKRALPLLGLSLVAGFSTSCLQIRWTRTGIEKRIAEERYAGLAPEHSNLTQALAALGAPNVVRELPNNGLSCAWAWQHGRNWGVTLQVPLGNTDLSFDYDDREQTTPAVMLFFDRNLVLTKLERGTLTHSFLEQRPQPRLVLPSELATDEAE